MEASWYKAEMEGKEGFVPDNYLDMRPHPWYVPHITRKNAEDILLERGNDANYIQPDGAFLVRTAEDEAGNFYLSVKYGDIVKHYPVLRDGVGKYFLWVVKFDSVNQLIKYHRMASVDRTLTIFLIDMVPWKMWKL